MIRDYVIHHGPWALLLWDWSVELLLFARLQAQAALFGGALLAFMLFSRFHDLPLLHRYDHIFVFAVLFQTFLLAWGFESLREATVIFGFHCVATVMELCKTSSIIGSWHYPEDVVLALYSVPLIAGFMYSAVGSYIARLDASCAAVYSLPASRAHLWPGHLDLNELLYTSFCPRLALLPGRLCFCDFLANAGAFHGGARAQHSAAGGLCAGVAAAQAGFEKKQLRR